MEETATDPGEMRVCTACIGELSYKEQIEQDGIVSLCDFDESHGDKNKTLTVARIAEIVDDEFRENYGPGGDVTEVSETSDKVFYSQDGSPYKEIVQENLVCSYELIEAVSQYLPDASPRDIQKGAESFYDDTSNYVSLDADDGDLDDYDPDDTSGISTNAAPRSAEDIYAELQSRVDELQKELVGLQTRPAGIGHNHPPEPIGPFDGLDKDFQDLEGALETLKAQPVKPPDAAIPVIETAALKIDAVKSKWRDGLTKIGGDLLGGMAKEAGKRLFGELVDDGWLHCAVVHLEQIATLACEWIHVVFSSLF